MKLFLDTANFDEIRSANEWGVLDGVTTNPTLLAKEAGKNGNKDYKQMLKEICAEVEGAVSAEVVSTDTEGMLREADELVQIAEIHLFELGPLTRTVHLCVDVALEFGVVGKPKIDRTPRSLLCPTSSRAPSPLRAAGPPSSASHAPNASLALFQSSKNRCSPMSVSGCFTSCVNTLYGIVAMSDPIRAASTTCIG